MEAKALVITMHHSLAEEEAETPGDTLRDVETEASADTLGDRLAEVKAEKVGGTLADVEGIAYTIRPLKADTLVDTIADV